MSAPHAVDVYVGERLVLARRMTGMSQPDVGRLTGVSFQQIQKYEKGTNRVSASRLYQFSKIFGVGINFFFDGFEGETDDKGPVEVEGSDMAMARRISCIRDPKVRDVLSRIIDCFARQDDADAA